MEMWQYFLLKGTLPWWVDETALNLQEVTLQLVKEQPAAVQNFLQSQRNHPHLWQRLTLQFTNTVKAQLITLLPALATAQALIQEWQQAISQQLTPLPATAAPEKLTDILLENAPKLLSAPADKNAAWQVFTGNAAAILIVTPEQQNTIITTLLPALAAAKGLQLPAAAAAKAVPPAAEVLLQPAYSVPAAADERYAVRHAGVILLAAFLRPFFTTLELWTGKEWQSKAACYRAVHLLKYLCTGQQQAPEYSLVMEKICCGLPLDEPIPLDIMLTEKEISESVLLLESIIGHWKMLKNTSVNGLRETFLKRDGILSRQENNWRLQVEQKTLDVLLDSIPWGFSTISLPWNGYLIFVEW
jgi:hypothetical protein